MTKVHKEKIVYFLSNPPEVISINNVMYVFLNFFFIDTYIHMCDCVLYTLYFLRLAFFQY